MEQAIPIVSGGNAQSREFDSAGSFKISGTSSEKIKEVSTKSDKGQEDLNGVVPFFQILNQQISQINKSSDDVSDIDEKNTAQEQETLQGDVKLRELQQSLTNLSQAVDEVATDQKEIPIDGLLIEIDSQNVSNTRTVETKTDCADLKLEMENPSIEEELKFERQKMEKQSLLKTDEKTLQAEKTNSGETQLSAGIAGKIPANLTEMKVENKSGNNILTAESSKDDSTEDNGLTAQETKETLISKDNLRQYSNPANTKVENKVQANAMQAIMGEETDKIKAEQKEKIITSGKENEEISLTAVNASGGGSAGTEKANNVSPDKIIGQVTGEIKEAVANDGGRVKMTLNPPSLGKLEMDVTVRNGKVEVVLVADNKDVQQTLNAHIDRLKDNLQNQGLIIDRCDVSMQDKKEEFQQNFSRHAFYQDGRSAQDGNERRGNSNEEANVGTGIIISEKPGSVLRASIDTDNISLFA